MGVLQRFCQCFAKVCDLSWGLWVVLIINCTSKNKRRFFRTSSKRGCSPCPAGTKEVQVIDSGVSWFNSITWHIGRFWASIPWKVQMLGFRFNRGSEWEFRSYVSQVPCGLENRPLQLSGILWVLLLYSPSDTGAGQKGSGRSVCLRCSFAINKSLWQDNLLQMETQQQALLLQQYLLHWFPDSCFVLLNWRAAFLHK